MNQRTYTLLSAITLLLVLTPTAFEPHTDTFGETRGITLTTILSHFGIKQGQTVDLVLNVTNIGTRPEVVQLSVVGKPENWTERFYMKRNYYVYAIYLLPDERIEVNFESKTPSDMTPGDYSIVFAATTPDKAVKTELEVKITVIPPEPKKKEPFYEERVELTTTYPVLEAASGTDFNFKVDLRNRSLKDQSFDLSATGPTGWTISFRPELEKTEIRTILVKSGTRKGLDIILSPPEKAKPGNYTFTIEARSENLTGTLQLHAVVRGTYELSLTTETGRLNTEAVTGEESHLTLIVHNKGTATLQDLSFTVTKPEEWSVTFNPDSIATLSPGSIRQIDVTIKPARNTIPGDYALTLHVMGQRVLRNLDIRVTVSTPTAWGYIGVGVVAAVAILLVLAFIKLGRR